MRALVISDTHFGAWTGRDLLPEERVPELRDRGVGGEAVAELPSEEHFDRVVRAESERWRREQPALEAAGLPRWLASTARWDRALSG